MAFHAAASVLGAMGHLANFGQVAEFGVSHVHQREQMQWARRAYRLDARTLRIDLLNAVKEDVRDHHTTHAGRIDTLLLVHTLLLTFALATLQFSGQYVPQTGESCPECVEVAYPFLVAIWVYLIAAILILPFWCILMLLWCKLQLDRWLELSVRRLNFELRQTLNSGSMTLVQGAGRGGTGQQNLSDAACKELESVEQAITRLGGFVADHQDRFAQVWQGECESMVSVTTNLLWVNAVVAVTITAGMFWMFLRNDLSSFHRLANHFLILVTSGLLAPLGYLAIKALRRMPIGLRKASTDEYVSCTAGESDDDPQTDYVRVDDSLSTPSIVRRLSGSPAAVAANPRGLASPGSGAGGTAGARAKAGASPSTAPARLSAGGISFEPSGSSPSSSERRANSL